MITIVSLQLLNDELFQSSPLHLGPLVQLGQVHTTHEAGSLIVSSSTSERFSKLSLTEQQIDLLSDSLISLVRAFLRAMS